jgi:hypothetical protein
VLGSAVQKLYVGDRVWYHMKFCKFLSSFIIKDVRQNARNSSARKRAVPKWYVGDLVWYQMKACKILSSFLIMEIGKSIRNSSPRERAVLKL